MESQPAMESIPTKENNETKEEQAYIEIEIPYTLFQFLSSENCNVQSVCRICLSTNNDVLYPLVTSKENSCLIDMFMALVTVRPTPEDGLPSSICEQCQMLVVQYYDFKIKCQRSECMLRSILKGEFICKEETADQSNMPVEEVDANIDATNDIKKEVELVEDVQYLEEFKEDPADSKLCIIQEGENIKRRSLKKALKGSLKKVLSVKKRLEKNPKSYTCIHCSKVFVKAKTFHIHMKNKHNIRKEKRPHPCTQCKESFESEHDLFVHSALHTKGSLWKCNQCQKQYKSKTTLRRHLQRHMLFKPHSCATCHKTFTELYALRRHVRVHTGERVEKKHACHICDKRYAESGLLAAHVARHAGARPCECAACHKRFPSPRLLASHMLVHTDAKPYACDYCDKRFRHESTRNIHHRTHTGEKPYVCSVCGKNFIQNSNLTLHMRTHTGERPYACNMCERKFTSGSSLKSHQRIHTGERPYSCKICGKRFARMNLGAHMRQHTGERPFACSACPKKFVNASRLRDHCRIHTGEKPYECEYCTSTFATKSQLVKHMKSHNPPKKKNNSKRELVVTQQVPSAKADNVVKENGELFTVTEDTAMVDQSNIAKKITLDVEVPLEVTGELILQDDSDIKAELLVVNNSGNNYPISNNDICLNPGNINIINGEVNYGSDMNLVTVNEDGVSISASALEGTTVKLYQLDQSLLQIHSSGGQLTISKITSKMTANF
ncbi:unnamed protein product [Arctia plantaginis]|uniref:Uncharacterized protein n=1 Tax=Arctia plantaginis TaxID=874455 RepID=A0A8S1AP94_ARCPL|nr:unnamed protein product [Arctia plantaginis]CAB3247524.1 unnamed protein product [Arctia plantaginis]